jgi:membrane protease YdiL (CAAX protease family)
MAGPFAGGADPPALSVAPAPQAVVAAWTVTLAVGALPVVVWLEVLGGAGAWSVTTVRWLLIAAFLVATLGWAPLRPLRPFGVVLAVIHAASHLMVVVVGSDRWLGWFDRSSFLGEMLAIQLPRVTVALVAAGALLALGFSRRDAFLTRGDLRARIRPVRWLGFPKADPWPWFGGQWALYLSLGTLAFLVLGGGPGGGPAGRLAALPALLPAVALVAALNAFGEEVTYRSALLAPLVRSIGPGHALWLTAVNFGVAHYYGVPSGLAGVVMATFAGWLLGKAMLETRGLAWPWFIHWCLDVVVFSTLAVGFLAVA